MSRKKRVLFINEASFLNTGFSVIGERILSHLYSTGKYEIAELGSYAQPSDPRISSVPWRFYPAMPGADDSEGKNLYHADAQGQFGKTSFENVCLDFKPDLTIDIRDAWMCTWQLYSPFRDHFRIVWMPTIDGRPQRLDWLDNYRRADMFLGYTDFAVETLSEEAPDIKIFDVVKPGVDHNVFKPERPKEDQKKKFGLSPDTNILLTVMRNQRRKLFPDLIHMFRKLLCHLTAKGDVETANKTYLYLHTSYPDVGFDLAKYIMEAGVSHRVLVTHHCKNCGSFYPSFFHGELSPCRNCGRLTAYMPNTNSGISREQLAEIYNLSDIYIQYSICEGLGMPPIEAKACGVPALLVDYSAMSEQAHSPAGYPIAVEKFFYEPVTETEQSRALPDDKDAIKKIELLLKMKPSDREGIGLLGRKHIVENYSLDQAALKFERAIDALDISKNKPWDSPDASLCSVNAKPPEHSTNASFVDFCIANILKKPSMINSYWRDSLVRGLNSGVEISGSSKIQIDRNKLYQRFIRIASHKNEWENRRLANVSNKTAKADNMEWQVF